LDFEESRYQGIYDYISMLMHGRTTDKGQRFQYGMAMDLILIEIGVDILMLDISKCLHLL
jgi:hypothetical protein